MLSSSMVCEDIQFCARMGPMVYHVNECWGKPCTSKTGGPSPWYRKWIETSSSWMRSCSQSSKFDNCANANFGTANATVLMMVVSFILGGRQIRRKLPQYCQHARLYLSSHTRSRRYPEGHTLGLLRLLGSKRCLLYYSFLLRYLVVLAGHEKAD